MEHKEREHSAISPSNSNKWLSCTASPYMEQEIVEETSSVFAEEGTLAHEIAEIQLRIALHKDERDLTCEHTTFTTYTNEGYPYRYAHNGKTRPELEQELLNLKKNTLYYEGMTEEVQIYVDVCLGLVGRGSDVFIEPAIDLSCLGEGVKGHIDFVVYQKETQTLSVVDLKFGRGVQVSAQDNSQLRLYAIGFMDTHKERVDTVILQICQPRRANNSVEVLSGEELNQIRTDYISIAEKIYTGDVDLRVGSHCKWCRAKMICPKINETMKELEFSANVSIDKISYTEMDLEYLLSIEGIISNFYLQIKLDLTKRLNAGEKLDLFKLVEGRGSTRVVDGVDLSDLLLDYGYSANQVFDVKPKSLSSLKKELGVKDFTTYVKPYTRGVRGKATLASIHDKKQSIVNSAEIDFSDIEIDE